MNKRILIIDDEPANIRLLKRVLDRERGFECYSTIDPREALKLCEEVVPDLILLDLNMPHINGLELLKELSAVYPSRVVLPIIILTADANYEAKHEALRAGASDFLTKPLDLIEVSLRIGQQLERKRLHEEVLQHNDELESRVLARTREAEEAQKEILDRLARATEFRYDDTGEHVERVACLTGRIARELGQPESEVALIEQAVRLHDVGKIAVPDHILRKPGPLNETERLVMQRHTTLGGQLLEGSRFAVLQKAEEIARCHHERWDGMGYPCGLQKDEIPLAARIAAVADVFDALTSERPYKEAWPRERAIKEILGNSGKHFDPEIVDAFVRSVYLA